MILSFVILSQNRDILKDIPKLNELSGICLLIHIYIRFYNILIFVVRQALYLMKHRLLVQLVLLTRARLAYQRHDESMIIFRQGSWSPGSPCFSLFVIKKHEESHTYRGKYQMYTSKLTRLDTIWEGASSWSQDAPERVRSWPNLPTSTCITFINPSLRNTEQSLIRWNNVIKSFESFFEALNYIYNMKEHKILFGDE